MKKYYLNCLISLIIFLIFSSVPISAAPLTIEPQFKKNIFLGYGGGFNLGSTEQMPTSNHQYSPSDLPGANGIGFSAGIQLEYILGEKPEESAHSLLFTLGARINDFNFSTTQQDGKIIKAIVNNPDEVSDGLLYESEYSCNIVFLSVAYCYRPFEDSGLGVLGGFDAGVTITNIIVEKYKIDEQDKNATFKEGIVDDSLYSEKRIIISDGYDVPERNAIRLGLIFGIKYDIEIDNSSILKPEIIYNYGLTSTAVNFNSYISYVQFNLSFQFDVSRMF
jgi:hypothetical protein